MSLAERVRPAITDALNTMADRGEIPREAIGSGTWVIERPKRPEHGDLATNVALAIQKRAGQPPRAIAEKLVKALAGSDTVASAEVAGPGFVNLRIHPKAFHRQVEDVLRAGASWGRAAAASGERINLEFVSANPTGPVTVASGRNAVLGDTVARLLEAQGNLVTREYYVNDRGNQVRKFAESVLAADAGQEPPEGGYKGAYVAELAKWIRSFEPDLLAGDPDALGRSCVAWMLRGVPGSRTLLGIRPSLADLRVRFDVWFSEESLHRWGSVSATMRTLEAGGYLASKEGALFFVAPEGALEDKDRVIRKTDGDWTYFASDVAYLSDKIARGFDRVMMVLGADHDGYVARLRNSLRALGLADDRFEALLYQLVFIIQGGEQVKSSKREGKFVTVVEVMDDIDAAAGRKGAGADALRFFFLSRSANSTVDFDVELAKSKSLDNPVFYMQYGYARLCSIQRNARGLGLGVRLSAAGELEGPGSLEKLVHPDELAISHKLGDFPEVVAEAARLREPHRIVFYVQELARDFQSYYTRLKAENDPILPRESTRAQAGWEASWDFARTRARLAWVEAIRITYAQALGLLDVTALERMDRAEGDDAAGAA